MNRNYIIRYSNLISAHLNMLIYPDKTIPLHIYNYTELILKEVLIKNMANIGRILNKIVNANINVFQKFFTNNNKRIFEAARENSNLILLCALNFNQEEKIFRLYNEHTSFDYTSIIDYLTHNNDLNDLDYTLALFIIKSLTVELHEPTNQKNIENIMNIIFLKLSYNFEKRMVDDFYFFKLLNFMNYMDKVLNNTDDITNLDSSFTKNVILIIGRYISIKTKYMTTKNTQLNDKIKKFKVIIDRGIKIIIKLYEFNDFYLETEGMFQHSQPQIFIDQIIKQILDEYNILINLSSMSDLNYSSTKKHTVTWKNINQDENPSAELIKLLHFLESLVRNINSDVLNFYLHTALQKNFNIQFIHTKLFNFYNDKNAELFIYIFRFMFKLNENIKNQTIYGHYIEQFIQNLILFELYSFEILYIVKGYLGDTFSNFIISSEKSTSESLKTNKKNSPFTLFLENFSTLISEGILTYEFNKLEADKANNILYIFIEILKYFFRKINESNQKYFAFTDKFCVSLTIIWIKLLKNFSIMDSRMIEDLKLLAQISPYLKSPKQYGLYEFEMNMIIQGTEEDPVNMKAILRYHGVLKEQNSENKKLFFIYNFLYYFLFKSKCDSLKYLKTDPYSDKFKHPQIIQNALLYLRGDYETQIGDKADKFLERIKRTFNIIVDYYNNELAQLSNFSYQFLLIKEDFVILLQYSVAEDTLLSTIARDLVNKYIEKYPFIFYSIEVFNTSTIILDILFRNYNCKFSTISTQLKTKYLNQHISIPAIKVM